MPSRYDDPPIFRIRVPPPDTDPLPEGEEPMLAPRQRGSRRPHTDGKVAQVRRLIEQTTLTYGEISKKTGVGRASICRWTRDGGWKRPLFAPRATDTVPTPRASQKLKLRKLAEHIRAAPGADERSMQIADEVEARPREELSPEVRERLDRINQILDEQVRPYLQGDGGDLYVMGLEGNRLMVHYQGACGSCPSSLSGTLTGIENLVRSIEPDIEVVAV